MQGIALALAAVLTVGYGYAVQAAMASDLEATLEQVRRAAETAPPERVWYGGTLDTIIIEAPAPEPETRESRAA